MDSQLLFLLVLCSHFMHPCALQVCEEGGIMFSEATVAMAMACKAKVNGGFDCPQSLLSISTAITESASQLWSIEEGGKRLSAIST